MYARILLGRWVFGVIVRLHVLTGSHCAARTGNAIGEAGATSLARALLVNSTVATLNLYCALPRPRSC